MQVSARARGAGLPRMGEAGMKVIAGAPALPCPGRGSPALLVTSPPSQVTYFCLAYVWGPGPAAPPHRSCPGNTALANLLRCFTCDRLCGGCTAPAPPFARASSSQPVMPSCDPWPGARLPPSQDLPQLPAPAATEPTAASTAAHIWPNTTSFISKVTASITPAPRPRPRLRPLQTLPGVTPRSLASWASMPLAGIQSA